MLDALLDWAAVFLPTILSIGGVLVSIKAPHSKHHRAWRVSLVVVGTVISGVTFWQQSRSRSAHASEITGLNSKIDVIRKQTETLAQNEQGEIARRQQAERDLAIIMQGVGKATREGVVSDIKQSPIRIHVDGTPAPPAPISIPNIKLTSSPEQSTHDDAKFCQKLVFQSDVPVNQLAVIIMLSAPAKYADLVLRTATLGGAVINKDDKKRLEIVFKAMGSGDDILTPEHPVVILVSSTEDFKPVSMMRAIVR